MKQFFHGGPIKQGSDMSRNVKWSINCSPNLPSANTQTLLLQLNVFCLMDG